jgi:hypothetical protein
MYPDITSGINVQTFGGGFWKGSVGRLDILTTKMVWLSGKDVCANLCVAVDSEGEGGGL